MNNHVPHRDDAHVCVSAARLFPPFRRAAAMKGQSLRHTTAQLCPSGFWRRLTSRGEFESPFAVIGRTVLPVLQHFRAQKQMNAAAEQILQFDARRLTDRLDRLPALADDD